MTKSEKKKRKKIRKGGKFAALDAQIDEVRRTKLLSFGYSRMELLFGVAQLYPWQQNMLRTSTGRFRSDGPNGSIVIRSEMGRIRSIPIPDKFQHENRYRRDLHSEKAAELFSVPVESVTPEQRNAAKNLVFREMYSGVSPDMVIVDEFIDA